VVLKHLVDDGYLETDGDLAFIGPEAERRFGRRHFSELMAVFTAAPEFIVLAGRDEIGTVGDEVLLADTGGGARVLLLAGRAWLVTYIDWKRRRCFVEATDLPGRAKWGGSDRGLSFPVTRGMRDVILGADPAGVRLSRRAVAALHDLRQHHSGHVVTGGSVLRRSGDGDVHWWTWAGSAVNRTLRATLGELVDPRQRIGDKVLRLRHDSDLREVAAALAGAADDGIVGTPGADARAITGLKFSAALPMELARATVAERLGDPSGALAVMAEPRQLTVDAG
jgi:ATP-dependent Lhr-like helicase